MNVFNIIFGKARKVLNSRKKIGAFVIVLLIIIFLGNKILSNNSSTPQYQTAAAEKGTLVTSISASGQITSANNIAITIQASGVVNEVLVKNGDSVKQGDTIATLTLDQASQQRAAAAYANYLSAQNTLNAARARINTLQANLFKANQAFITDRGVINPSTDQQNDPVYIEENATWLQAEADYKNQANVILAAQISLNSAALNLSQSSATITAPAAGVIKGLTITKGAIVALLSGSTSSTSVSQVLGSIYQEGPVQAQVSLSEIDSVNVIEGQKATMTMDAFPDKTFTGKVVSINTNGVVSSGVTTYPAVITFDSGNSHMYPNMAVTAEIITSVKNDVILVPSSSVQTTNGESTVRVMKNGHVAAAPVEIGDSNDTQTEIISGINEGDVVVTAVINASIKATGTTVSPFNTTRGLGGFGGGGGGRAATTGR